MELSMQTTPHDVLTKIPNTQISLTVGEIIGMSQELSTALADRIHVKTVTLANTISNHTCADHGTLLWVPVQVGRYTHNAIIVSGSEVNLIKCQVWEKDLKVPMDVSVSMMLRDANGGTSTLKGIIPNLEPKIRELITTSNYWVTTTCPLDILLGRPWQWQKLVSIDERTEGTYLQFNCVNRDQVMEILVTPHNDNNDTHQISSQVMCAMSHTSYLGMTAVELTLVLPPCESHYPALSHTSTGVNHVTQSNFDTCQAFKQDRLGLEEPGGTITDPSNALKISYF